VYTLTVTREINGRTMSRRYEGRNLPVLIVQAGEYDTATITDPDGRTVYALEFPSLLANQAS